MALPRTYRREPGPEICRGSHAVCDPVCLSEFFTADEGLFNAVKQVIVSLLPNFAGPPHLH